jgi:hypothetical protein
LKRIRSFIECESTEVRCAKYGVLIGNVGGRK